MKNRARYIVVMLVAIFATGLLYGKSSSNLEESNKGRRKERKESAEKQYQKEKDEREESEKKGGAVVVILVKEEGDNVNDSTALNSNQVIVPYSPFDPSTSLSTNEEIVPPHIFTRKKVGVVLSGGGAKGTAHVGALKVLEEAGIPIDYIAGTSMGAIVGGLYAIGYDTQTMDSMIRSQDWRSLLVDRVQRRNLSFEEKQNREKYLFTVPVSREKKIIGAGVVGGHNIYNLLSELTIGYHDSLSFRELPIPFSCVAYDMVTGETVVLDGGELPRAIRASMSIPGAFEPVKVGERLLIDGGISNNFPVDVVKEMGADIVIGIDVGASLRTKEQINTLSDMFNQITYLVGEQNYIENKSNTDLYIHPDVSTFHAGSFNTASMITLMDRGEEAVREAWGELMEIRRRIGLGAEIESTAPKRIELNRPIQVKDVEFEGVENQREKTLERVAGLKEYSIMYPSEIADAVSNLQGIGPLSKVNYRLEGGEPYNLIFSVKEASRNTVSLGFRFDSEEMAAVLLNATLATKRMSNSHFDITARLSESPYIRGAYVYGNEAERQFTFSYKYKNNNMSLYNRNKKYSNFDFGHHIVDVNYSNIRLRNFKIGVGLEYEFYDYYSTLTSRDLDVNTQSQGFVNYYVTAHYESLDRRYNPKKGQRVNIGLKLNTTDFLTYKGDAPYGAINFDYLVALSVSKRVAFLPGIFGRVLIGDNYAFSAQNFIGGTHPGRYIPHQMPFVGLSKIELVENAIVGVKLDVRVRLWVKNFVSLKMNYAKTDRTFNGLLNGKDLYGVGLAYSYNSIVGPLEAQIDWSNRDQRTGVYFNLGYYF